MEMNVRITMLTSFSKTSQAKLTAASLMIHRSRSHSLANNNNTILFAIYYMYMLTRFLSEVPHSTKLEFYDL